VKSLAFTEQVNLRITKAQYNHCMENGGISSYIRHLIDLDILAKNSRLKGKVVKKVLDSRKQKCGY
jgi:hypothetical protein